MKKGSLLELIASELERNIADNPTTKIIRNHKLPDRDGAKRDIDIYVEIEVNKKLMKYAIECKDYGPNTYINLSQVDIFYSMIANHGMKGIILTTSIDRFRKNALRKAKNLGIEVYIIETSQDSIIQKLSFFQKRFQVSSVSLFAPAVAQDPTIDLPSCAIYMGKPKEKWDFVSFCRDYIKRTVEKAIERDTNQLYKDFLKINEDRFEWSLNDKKEYLLWGDLNLVYFKKGSEYYPITRFKCKIHLWIEYTEIDNFQTKDYKSEESERVFAKFISERIRLDENKYGFFNIIQTEGQESFRITFMTGDEKIDERITFNDGIEIPDLTIEVKEGENEK